MGKNGEDGRRGFQGQRVSIELVFFTWGTFVQKTMNVFCTKVRLDSSVRSLFKTSDLKIT